MKELDRQLPREVTSRNFENVMKIMLERMDLFVADAGAELAAGDPDS